MDFGPGEKTLLGFEKIVKDCFLLLFFSSRNIVCNKNAIVKQIKGFKLSDSTIMRCE